MRALVVDDRGLRLESNHPVPSAKPGEAVVRLVRAAVSRVDLGIGKGEFDFRGVIGHQFVGVVDSINGQPANLVGKRVAGSPVIACGSCDMCMAGLSLHCRNRKIVGMQGCDGCFADRFVMPTKNLAVVPDTVDDDHAVFAVDLASALQAAGQITIEGKPFITVLGDDSVALLTAQVMAKLNASVRLIGADAQRIAKCEKWGIKHRPTDDVGRRADQDIVVECTGTTEGLALALQMVRPRGKVMLKSFFGSSPKAAAGPLALDPILLNEIEVIGSFMGSIAEAITLLARREVDTDALITKRMSLGDGAAIMKSAVQPGVIKVVVGV